MRPDTINVVEFVEHSLYDPKASKKQKREVFVMTLCVRIAADRFSSIYEPATEEDKLQYPALWEAYVEKQEVEKFKADRAARKVSESKALEVKEKEIQVENEHKAHF